MRMNATCMALAAATLALAAATATRAGDDEEWERDLDLAVPETPGENEQQHRVLVIDEATGLPVPWATVRHYTEMTSVRAHLLRIRRCDGHGLVEFDSSVWPRDGHFVVEAPGYATAHEYGVVPSSPVELVRPREVAMRLLDGMGRPVANTIVRAHEGCGHAPDLARTKTDADGRFVLRGIAPRTAMLWAEAEGTRADYIELDTHLRSAGGECVVVLGAGVVAEGVVTDAEGHPLAGVLVRSQQAQRGPAVLTGADGRFRLVGMQRGESLAFTHPLGESFSNFGNDAEWEPGFSLRIRLTPWEIVRPEGPTRKVRIRVSDATGRPVASAAVTCIRENDGWAKPGVTDDDPPDPEDDDDEDVGEAVLALHPGAYRLLPSGAFETHELSAAAFVVGPGDGEVHVPVRATPRPRFAVTLGEGVEDALVPEDAAVRLVVEGDETDVRWDDAEVDPLHLPAEGEAVVRVVLDDGVWFLPVGPLKDGVRSVVLDIPAPRLLRIPNLGEWEDAALLDGSMARTLRETDEGLVTWATGDLTLRLVREQSGLVSGPALDVPVRIPAEGTEPIDVAVPSGDARRALDVVLRAEAPGDAAFEATYRATDSDGLAVASDELTATTPARFPFRAGTSVRIERDGWATLRATLDGPGERVFRWGDAALSITARDEDGEPAKFTLLLDGQRESSPEDPEAPLVLRGLAAGPVELVLLPHDEDFQAKEMRLVLRPGETRTRAIVFGRR